MVATVPVAVQDESFLFQVYAETRRDEVAAWGWAPAQQEAFLRMQFQLQQRSYAMQFPGAGHQVILHEGVPAGQVMVLRLPDSIRLIDMAVLPDFQGKGLGTAVLQGLQAEARQAGKPLQLSVRKENMGARRLYERLGFITTAQSETQYAMEWRPERGDADVDAAHFSPAPADPVSRPSRS
ncbi:MAG TPA: GNAT family N-acetyltransferase [Symbiobacteriaceae bacterium]|jgi:ribosomal protein S18 acetylase RimI-like enzyme|nr:GNAT family N-acetyltransferase [Symbiobacteriaceae bacterium]